MCKMSVLLKLCVFFTEPHRFNRKCVTGRVAAFQLLGPWFDPELELLVVWSFACCPHVIVGFLHILRFLLPPKTMPLVGLATCP